MIIIIIFCVLLVSFIMTLVDLGLGTEVGKRITTERFIGKYIFYTFIFGIGVMFIMN